MTIRKKGYKIIVMVFVLLACTMLVAFKSQETNVKYIRTNYVSGTHGKTYVIESLEGLEEYYNANKEKHNLGHREKVYSDTTIGFADATKEYDEEFFKEHNIVLVLLTASSGSIRYKVANINLNDGIMEINITKKTPEIGTCDMAGWHIIIETDKQEIEEIKDCEVILAVFLFLEKSKGVIGGMCPPIKNNINVKTIHPYSGTTGTRFI